MDDNNLIKESGKAMDSGSVRNKKASYSKKKKELASKGVKKGDIRSKYPHKLHKEKHPMSNMG